MTYKHDRQRTYNVTLRRVGVTTVVVVSCVYNLRDTALQCACAILSAVVCTPHIVNDTTFGKNKLFNTKCMCWFSLQICLKYSLSKKNREMPSEIHTSCHAKCSLFCPIYSMLMKLEFFRQIFETYSRTNFMIIPPVKPSCSMCKNKHHEANNRLSRFCKSAWR